MERPDQDKEEWKEEPEYGRAGYTWTGPFFSHVLRYWDTFKIERMLHSVHHNIDLERAGQRGSETRTKFSDQDKEERKEEPESVKTGDTWTGRHLVSDTNILDIFITEEMLHSVHHDIDLERAGHRGSETRTKFSDQDKEEWKEEPEYGRAGVTWTGPRSASRKPHALRPLLLMEENFSPAANDIDNDTADQHRSETRRTESSAWGDGPFSPRTFVSRMRRWWPTTHREDDCDFPDQPRTRKSGTQGRTLSPEYTWSVFRTCSTAAVWIMVALTMMTSSLAGATCIGTEVKLDKDEAVLRCPLPVDVSATHRGIIVKHFPTPDSADTVMFCYWPEGADKAECDPSDSFSLVGQLTDQVVAKVPVSRLKDSRAYKCQLYPPDYQRPFTPCHIHPFIDNDEVSTVVPTPVISSIATNGSTPGQDPLIREAPPCVGQSGSVALTAAVLVQIIIIILLVFNVLYLQSRKDLQTRGSETKRRKSSPEYPSNMFWTWSAAAVWIMVALTVATSSLAGATCIGTEVELDKGQAVLRCPLHVNASATRQGIIVKHFPTSGSADTVMYCYWPEEADKPECYSSDSFSLVGQLTDQVVAKVPVSRLIDSGVYKVQLHRLGGQPYFIPCHIHPFSGNDEGSAVVPTPVVSSIATQSSTPGQDPLIREAPPCVGQSDSVALTAAVLVLQVLIIILMVVNVLYLHYRQDLQGKNECMKDGWMAWLPWNSSEKKPVTSEGEPMNSQNEAVFIPESAVGGA